MSPIKITDGKTNIQRMRERNNAQGLCSDCGKRKKQEKVKTCKVCYKESHKRYQAYLKRQKEAQSVGQG